MGRSDTDAITRSKCRYRVWEICLGSIVSKHLIITIHHGWSNLTGNGWKLFELISYGHKLWEMIINKFSIMNCLIVKEYLRGYHNNWSQLIKPNWEWFEIVGTDRIWKKVMVYDYKWIVHHETFVWSRRNVYEVITIDHSWTNLAKNCLKFLELMAYERTRFFMIVNELMSFYAVITIDCSWSNLTGNYQNWSW